MNVTWILVTFALAGLVQQERPADKLPQKGDAIIVKGCLKGSSLESTETGVVNSDATMLTTLVYRLTGDKSTLKQMKQEYDGQVVEVTGILKSTLPPTTDIRSKTVGRTRITIGVGSSHVGSPAAAEANRSIPVLEVKSYEGVSVKCSG